MVTSASPPALAEIQFPDTPFPLFKHLAMLGRRGSEAHGTYIPPTDEHGIDDRDLMGVVIPPERYYIGLAQWEHAEAIKGVWDVVLYELRKFVRLLRKQNPNVLSLLWLESEDYLHVGPVGQALIDNRELFRHGPWARAAFVGYAHGQLKRMTHFQKEGFMGQKRMELVDRFGYDCKNAAHLIRLLHMGAEYLETGQLHVRRTWDRDMLLQIKQGEWLLDEVEAHADEWFAKVERVETVLPDRLDDAAIEQLVVTGIRASLAAQ
jgi:uncharacterized protein